MSTSAPTTFTTNVLIADDLVVGGAEVTTTNTSCALEVQSSLGAMVLPRMTTAQRNAMTLINGMVIYNSTANAVQFRENGAWNAIGPGGGNVNGPGASTDKAVVRWDGLTGTAVLNSTVILSDAGDFTGVHSVENDLGTVLLPSYTFTGDTNTGIYSSGANTVDITTNGLRQVSIGTVAAAVNYIQMIGSATGTPLLINAVGTDANIGVQIVPKGTGALIGPVGAEATPGFAFSGDVDSGMWHSAANTIDFSTNALRQVQIGTVAATVNYLQFIGSATTTPVLINAQGTDLNIGVEIVPKGTGALIGPVGAEATPGFAFSGDVDTGMWHSGANTIDFSTNGLRQVSIGTVAATVNYLQFIGSAAGTSLKINAVGTDGNIDIQLTPKGTGAVIGPVGAVATPAYTFLNDTDTGMWRSAANTIAFSTNGALALTIDPTANLGIRTSTFGTNATNTLGIATGVAPTTGPADTIQIYSSDVSAGNTTLSLFTEGTPISATTITAADNSLAIRVNGTIYYIPCKLTNN